MSAVNEQRWKLVCFLFVLPLINYSVSGVVLRLAPMDEETPPMYASPGLDLEQELIGTATQEIVGRVGTAATCLVAGVEYTHGQQIYRADQCEYCLCLDGEMFCWWQDCPPESLVNVPCRDRFPFGGGPCNFLQGLDGATTSTQVAATTGGQPSSTGGRSAGTKSVPATTLVPADTTSAAATPTVCLVMGAEYRVGDVLPHDTGNCVQCVCGEGAQVTCAPHQCAPADEDEAAAPDPQPARAADHDVLF